ncbi:MAG: hypothetical protein GC149_20445 [Gammaproteobacteria bacterium]|nr:hypothetical protein [Gammaproteobacteria bacterium]
MFKSSNLSVLAYANNFTLWHYDANADGLSIADVGKEGFFNEANDMVRVRDVIIVGATDQVRQVTVTKNANSEVGIHLPGVFGSGLSESENQGQQQAA